MNTFDADTRRARELARSITLHHDTHAAEIDLVPRWAAASDRSSQQVLGQLGDPLGNPRVW
ncbi:MAG: hypothetical protein IPJ34_21675 [Myxococcales bacterium]|nr:hypothetical protein [Myxococcales bacterium]